jgi:DNA-directed RNA polymerase subunit RPC12/RpoP
MIKVIKHGQKEFEHICSRCGCEFTYEYEDIHTEAIRGLTTNSTTRYVVCPDCGNKCSINGGNIGWPWPNTGEPIPCNTPSETALNPCIDCDWHKKMTTDGINWYVGDTPCTWCQKNPMKVTCGSIGTNVTTPKTQLFNSDIVEQSLGDCKITTTNTTNL